MFINWLEYKWISYTCISSNFFQYHVCKDLGIIDVSVIFLYICTVYITLVTVPEWDVTVPDWDEGRWDVTTSEARINGLLLTRGGRTSSEVFDLKKVNMNHYNVYQNEKQNTINTISINIISAWTEHCKDEFSNKRKKALG